MFSNIFNLRTVADICPDNRVSKEYAPSILRHFIVRPPSI